MQQAMMDTSQITGLILISMFWVARIDLLAMSDAIHEMCHPHN